MRFLATLILAAVILIAIAHRRPPEYDEAYSIFLTAGDPRPAWPTQPFHSSDVRHFFFGPTTFSAIAQNLRTGDVHPPLYFWCLNLWRHIFGPSWFTARLLSVVLSLATLATLSQAARIAGIPVIPTLLITLLAYAFPYTSILARNFALAQLLNTLALTLALASLKTGDRRLTAASGLVFSAATFTNYLSIFTPLAILLWLITRHFGKSRHSEARSGEAIHLSGQNPPPKPTVWLSKNPVIPAHAELFFGAGLLTFLPLDANFFLAQHASRHGQFPSFHLLPALVLIAKDIGAAIFGGLPLYAGDYAAPVAGTLFLLFVICLNTAAKPALFILTALATPIGLFLLGLAFNNTPIEIRYLAFSIPSLALILATIPKPLLTILILVESLGTIGLAFAPSTMQSQALAAREAAAQSTPSTLTLVPYGNDGVGIPGPFIAAAPDSLTIQLIKSAPNLAQLPPHIILATISADDSSRRTISDTLAALAGISCWHGAATTPHTQSFTRTCTNH
jgi:hypothetical protein